MHRRKNIRLKGYDYSQNGAYFITICTYDHNNHLGAIIGEKSELSNIGIIVQKHWFQITEYYQNVELDEFTIMPNHIHGIVFILNNICRGEVTSPGNYVTKLPALGKIIAYFKYQSTKAINNTNNTPGYKFWQRGYYDHIIRNENSLNNIREYIRYNYLKWNQDRENLLNYLK